MKNIRIALAGNPNAGKTTFFNVLTRSNAYVGNRPGVTVEKKEGRLKKNSNIVVVDLPGIYSLSPYTSEEVVARNYLVYERPDVILNVIDGTNLERNLYLTTQLIELAIPVVVVINMMDLVKKRGDKIDLEMLSVRLGCPVVDVSAATGDGIDNAVERAVFAVENKTVIPMHLFSGAVEHAVAHIEEACLHDMPEDRQRWFAIKIFERDKKVLEQLNINDSVIAHIENDIVRAETELGDDAEAIITNERYNYIEKLLHGCYEKRNIYSVSDKIDKIVTNRYLAIPLFFLLITAVYFVAVSSVGRTATDFINLTLFGKWIIPSVRNAMTGWGVKTWLVNFVADGLLAGLAAPVSFAPQMALVFFFLSFLEECGYMSRVAFIMDRIFRKFGLSGKSFIPMLLASGCGVPAIMATRTIENEDARKLTMMTATFIPCSAKLPLIILIAVNVFHGAWWVAPLMYLIGILCVMLSCIILKKTKMFSGEKTPFVMEMPGYHLPSLKNIIRYVLDNVWSFLKKAGTVLFVCCTVMWFLSSFGFQNGRAGWVDPDHSIVAWLGGVFAFLFRPLGFGSWKAIASSLAGFLAKEGIVSTMQITGYEPVGISAFAFMMFNLINSPCIAAVTTLGKEMGSKSSFAFALVYQNLFAYALTLIVYQAGALISGQTGFTNYTVAALGALAILLVLVFRKEEKENV